ncbi:flagellar assembly protein FliH [Undibacterium sp. LX40W]|uniref:Flagellar assembly protein FliH n=1 Tax=Undibacterium nitidum TaxID=2762298 RepID=A0A923KK24_9BURK|nr:MULTISPECIES: flagellar assembly protein FliH [Undibacterium]MBC3880305.1 flagellar assembly protein FliH [Undibacterium nitidum]MBC3890959.1 flagellar assembly protein FliH [Undibacterium sp. LX40W]
MSSVLPKGQQTAYQRWELTSFGDARASQVEKQNEVSRIAQAEINAIKEQARNEAYAEGYKEAYQAGFNEGQQAGYAEMQEQARTLISHIEGLAQQFQGQLNLAHEVVGDELLQLAISLASSMTKKHFELAPESITTIVQEAIALLPSIQQPAQIFLHPEDLDLVKELASATLEKDGWRLFPDHQMTRGGCRIETGQNVIDATYETRWNRLTENLIGVTHTAELV